MATLTLKKKPSELGKTPGRAPVRGKGHSRPRPTLTQAQSERQEREARFQQRQQEEGRGEPRRRDERSSFEGEAPRRSRPEGSPSFDEQRRSGPPQRPGHGPHGGHGGHGGPGGPGFGPKPSSRFQGQERGPARDNRDERGPRRDDRGPQGDNRDHRGGPVPERAFKPGTRGYGADPGRPFNPRDQRDPRDGRSDGREPFGGRGGPGGPKPFGEPRARAFGDAAPDNGRNTGLSPGGIKRGSRGQDRGRLPEGYSDGRPQPRSLPRAHQNSPLSAGEEGDRLSKRMGELGLASRREADDWIAAGWVKVDGKVAVLGQRVGPNARIDIDPAARTQQAQQVTILLHKPIGYVSGQAEDGYEPASVLVQPQNRWDEDPSQVKYHEGHRRSLAPAGRLDIDSTGLLVLTQDGRVAKLLIGEDSTIEKEYLVRVEPINPVPEGAEKLSAQDLALLNHGLELDGEKLKPAKVSWQNEDQLRFVLREGKKRQIRRMCELVGLKVVGLKRVRIGRINLGHLPPGQWRYLGPWERFD